MIELSRRVFLGSGMAACCAGALVRHGSAHTAAGAYYRAVFDARFQDASRFAEHAFARNIRAVAIHGDITKLFYDDLDLRWRHGPVSLTGFTTPASLFCIDLLARDRGMRLRHCVAKPSVEVALSVLDRAQPSGGTIAYLPPFGHSDLLFWIIAPNPTISEQDSANA